jgi:hypothetical protein
VDALRYALYSYIGPVRTPATIRQEEAITASDPTIAMLQRRLAEERWQRSSQSSTYAPRRRGR